MTWTVDVFREGAAVCLRFLSGDGRTGGGGEACHSETPLGVSLQRAVYGQFAFGLASDRVMRVRFEHSDGAIAVLDTVMTSGFTERFFGGLIEPLPHLRRIVGLDAAGNVIAEHEVKMFNEVPPPPS